MAPPTSKTREDLARQALKEVRIVRAGEPPTAVQRADADTTYDGIYAELQVQGIAFWDPDAIPVTVFLPLAKLVAQELAPSFGKAYDAGDAMARLRIAAAKPWSGKTPRTDYF